MPLTGLRIDSKLSSVITAMTISFSSAANSSPVSITVAGLVVILLLIVLLISKELVGALASDRSQRLNRGLNVGVVPITFVFLVIVIARFV